MECDEKEGENLRQFRMLIRMAPLVQLSIEIQSQSVREPMSFGRELKCNMAVVRCKAFMKNQFCYIEHGAYQTELSVAK